MNSHDNGVAIVISCSDARLEDAMSRLRELLKKHSYPYLNSDSPFYRIQVPGPDGILLGQHGEDHQKALFEDIQLLIEKANATALVFIPHCECAGCQVSDETHKQYSTEAAEILNQKFSLPVISMLDKKVGDTWQLNITAEKN